ncbi:hypothetical protein HID58_080294 [Brassica napus]|uniref:Uncharacterized protein n=1 Tax=Brassica napus TaxID=3708 RepID=A0ABQ7Y722_BRANA|nr:hypothetical protein HID58_080294 [Brassica napus]
MTRRLVLNLLCHVHVGGILAGTSVLQLLLLPFASNEPASLDVEFSIFSGSFAGGGAAVFPTLGQASFRGTTPTELDEYSKANSSFDSPSYVTYQSCEPGRKMLCAASEPFIFLLSSYELGRIGGAGAC